MISGSRMWIIPLTLVLLGACSKLDSRSREQISSAVGGEPDREEQIAAIDSIAHAALHEGPIAGLSIAVLQRGDLLVDKGYGLANVQDAVPASAATRYDIASVSKLFTAAAIMRLVETKQLRLEDTLTSVLPSFPNREQGERITVRHLLSHTSGLKDYEAADTERWLKDSTPLNEAFVQSFLRDRPLEFEPDSRWSYSNSGYYLLALIIEHVTGRSYGAFIHEEIAEPLSLTQTALCDDLAGSKHATVGYEPHAERLTPSKLYVPRNIVGDGGLCSTASDLVRFPRALRAGTIVSQAAVTAMMKPTVLTTGLAVDYGLGVRRGELEGRNLWGHTGGMRSYWASLMDFPQDEVTIAVLVNTDGANEDALTIAGHVAQVVLGLAEPALKDLALSEHDIRRIGGSYGDGTNRLTFFADGTRLMRAVANSAQPPRPLLHQGEGRFARADYPMDRAVFHLRGDRCMGVSEYYNGMFATFWAPIRN